MPIVSSNPPVVGQRYGFLTVLDEGEVIKAVSLSGKTRYARLVCVRCDCGAEKRLSWNKVRTGHTSSCGCYKQRVKGDSNRKHGGSSSPLYRRWHELFRRCEDKKRRSYKDYGGRGITVCDEWRDFETFRTWALSNGFRPELQIDRIDNDKGYSPDNCRWVDCFTNAQNKRSNANLTAFGETKCLQEWARDPRCSVTAGGIRVRLKYGWSPEESISTPPGGRQNLLCAFGEWKTQLDWSRDPRCQVTQVGLSWRLRHGWEIESAITTPPTPPKEKNPTGKGAIRRQDANGQPR